MKRIVILTGSEVRHDFFRRYIALSKDIEVLASYCEGTEKSIQNQMENSPDFAERNLHLAARLQSERDFFSTFIEVVEDISRPTRIPKGDINLPDNVLQIKNSNPDLLIAYGCSLIDEELVNEFAGRFLNVHLGLSPWYRGSGTNYWPLVNGEPEFVGATFMYIDNGIDTGEIIHQIRARLSHGDTPSQIGNRLIADMARKFRDIIVYFDSLARVAQTPDTGQGRIYRNRDFTEESVKTLYKEFRDGLIDRYLEERGTRCDAVPLVVNPALVDHTP